MYIELLWITNYKGYHPQGDSEFSFICHVCHSMSRVNSLEVGCKIIDCLQGRDLNQCPPWRSVVSPFNTNTVINLFDNNAFNMCETNCIAMLLLNVL